MLISLSAKTTRPIRRTCDQYLPTLNESTPGASSVTQTSNQITMNISAPASHFVIAGLPPDNFYRILLFAMSQSHSSPPASVPSSPRVPALPPQTAPSGVSLISFVLNCIGLACRVQLFSENNHLQNADSNTCNGPSSLTSFD